MMTSNHIQFTSDQPDNRRAVAAHKIPEGTLVAKEEMLEFGIISSESSTVCQGCLKDFGKMLRCSACKGAFYCGKSCQQNHWNKIHKAECKFFKRAKDKSGGVPAQFTLLVRLVMRANLLHSVKFENDEILEIDILNSLKSESPLFTEEQFELADQHAIEILAIDNEDLEEKDFELSRRDQIRKIFLAILLNSFSIPSTTNYLVNIGIGIFAKLSWINHSCRPNCFTSIEGSEMSVVTAHSLSEDEEITIPYISILANENHRKEILKEQFYFECWCDRCQRKQSFHEEEYSSPIKAQSSAEFLQLSTNSESIEQIIKRMEEVIPEYSYSWFDLMKTKEQIYYSDEDYKSLYMLRSVMTSKLEFWFKSCQFNPIIGWHYATLAKLANHLGKPKTTIRAADRALQILSKYYSVSPILSELAQIREDSLTFMEYNPDN